VKTTGKKINLETGPIFIECGFPFLFERKNKEGLKRGFLKEIRGLN